MFDWHDLPSKCSIFTYIHSFTWIELKCIIYQKNSIRNKTEKKNDSMTMPLNDEWTEQKWKETKVMMIQQSENRKKSINISI